MESLLIAIGLLVVVLIIGVRFVLPREVWTEVLSEIIHDALQGIWHLIFGPRKVRVDRDKKKKVVGLINKKRPSK